MIFNSGITIIDIVLILALCFFALWKTGWIRIVTSLCLIIWGAFALQYDIKIAAPLIGIGAVLFIMAVMNLISRSKQRREEA
jgi:hypothetical protein